MSSALRSYQAVVHQIGTVEPSESTIDFVIGIGSDAETGTLFKVPVIEGQRVYPLQGRTDFRPFMVEGVDVDGELTAAFTVAERWRAIGRLVQVRFRDVDSENSPITDWRYLGTGRVTQFDALDGEGKYRLSVGDESWKLRKFAQIFEHADTTQWWPAGHTSYWRGFPAAIRATVTRFENEADFFFVKLLAVGYDGFEGTTQNTGVRISEKLRSAIRSDLIPEEDWQQPTDALITHGNFRHLRLNFGGHDYQILKFSGPADGPILESIDSPEEIDGGQGSWAIQIWCWCFRDSDDPEPPASGEGYLYAPTAEPTPDAPLHAGMADTGHWLGTSLGFIHFAEFTQRILDLLQIVYDPDNVAAFIADKSFPAIAPRIDERPQDPMRWLQDKIFQFVNVTHGRDEQGRFRFIDLRPKRTVEDGIPVLDITNAKNHRWLLSGDEQINSVNYKVLKLSRPPIPVVRLVDFIPPVWSVDNVVDPNEVTLDNFLVKEETTDPEDGDTLDDSGRRLLTFDATAAAYVGSTDSGLFGFGLGRFEVQRRILLSGAGALFEHYKAFTTPNTLATYQDGLRRGVIEVEGELSETLQEGGEFYLDHDSLKIATPGSLGAGLPPGVGPLNPGGSPVALDDPPTLSSPALLSDLSIEVPVASIPTGLTARVEYATTGDCDNAPDPGSSQYFTAEPTRTTVGDSFVPAQPRGACVWIIVSGELDGVRVTEYSTPVLVEIPDWPHFDGVLLRHVGDGVYVVTWAPSDLTVGVLVCWAITDPGTSATVTPECEHVDASEKTFTIPDTVPLNSQLSVTVTAYPEFESGVVGGDAGQVWPVSAIRRETLSDVAATLPICLSDPAKVECTLQPEHGGTGLDTSDLTGTTGQLLASDGAGGITLQAPSGMPGGTSFPGSPSEGEYFRRDDRGGIAYRYDGTRWLSTQIFHHQLFSFVAANASVSGTVARMSHPWTDTYDIYVEKAWFNHLLSGTGNWTLSLQKVNTAGTGTEIASSGAFSTTARTQVEVAVNVVVPVSDNIIDFLITATENSGTATLSFGFGSFTYRLIG